METYIQQRQNASEKRKKESVPPEQQILPGTMSVPAQKADKRRGEDPITLITSEVNNTFTRDVLLEKLTVYGMKFPILGADTTPLVDTQCRMEDVLDKIQGLIETLGYRWDEDHILESDGWKYLKQFTTTEIEYTTQVILDPNHLGGMIVHIKRLEIKGFCKIGAVVVNTEFSTRNVTAGDFWAVLISRMHIQAHGDQCCLFCEPV